MTGALKIDGCLKLSMKLHFYITSPIVITQVKEEKAFLVPQFLQLTQNKLIL